MDKVLDDLQKAITEASERSSDKELGFHTRVMNHMEELHTIISDLKVENIVLTKELERLRGELDKRGISY